MELGGGWEGIDEVGTRHTPTVPLKNDVSTRTRTIKIFIFYVIYCINIDILLYCCSYCRRERILWIGGVTVRRHHTIPYLNEKREKENNCLGCNLQETVVEFLWFCSGFE